MTRYADMMQKDGPIPYKSGAGSLSEDIRYGNSHECHCLSTTEFSKNVAKSYKYPVVNNEVLWTIPKNYRLDVVNFVVTSTHYGDMRKSKTQPIKCWWPVKSRGYSGKWQEGYLYRGVHAKSLRGLVATVDRDRQKTALVRWNARKRDQAVQDTATHVWITTDKLRDCGACSPGINAAKAEVMVWLNACGDIGAVLASELICMGGKFKAYALRVVSREMV